MTYLIVEIIDLGILNQLIYNIAQLWSFKLPIKVFANA